MTVGKNVGKTKCWLFDNHSSLDEVPLQLPKLSINNQKKKKKKKKKNKKKKKKKKKKKDEKRASYAKFLGVLLDKNMSRKEHLRILYCHCIFLTFIHA